MSESASASADKYADYSREQLLAEINRLKKNKKYGLVWEHKKEQVIEDFETQQPYLQEVAERRIENAPGEPTNLIIEGDNFEALSILNYTHAGKVDVIYIDPPYNTGNKDFIYNDNYVDSEDEFRHSKWLSFMEPRLKLAKNLLKDDGVIFISIDDNERAQLKMLLDDVFGARNFVNDFVWINNLKGRQISGAGAAGTHESVLCYSKSSNLLGNFFGDAELLKQCMPSTYKGFNYEVRSDKKGKYIITNELYNSNSAFNEETRPNLVFNIWYNPVSKDIKFDNPNDKEYVLIKPHANSDGKHSWHAYRWSKKKIIAESDDLEFEKYGESYRIYTKRRDFNQTIVKDVITDINTTNGSVDLKLLKFDNLFSYPKPVKLIEVLISCIQNRNGIVLDFFAGSGTTGQSVLELNKEDGGHRQFILCTNNGDKGPDSAKIAEDITYPRVKTVITGKRQDGSKYSDGIPANLRYYKINHHEKKPSIDANRQDFAPYMEDILQVKENAYKQLEVDEDFALYEAKDKYVGIVLEPFALEEIIEKIKQKNTDKRPVKMYVFSYSRDALEDEYDVGFEISFAAMPEGILKTYANIVAEIKKEDA